jgi:hypothetical protein
MQVESGHPKGIVLTEEEWCARERAHRERVEPWIEGRLARRRRGLKHPIEDFLFEYYPYSTAKLLAWHPGHGTALSGEGALRFLTDRHYVRGVDGVASDLARAASWKRARWQNALEVLRGTASRPPAYACFGMHEWAMVYGSGPDDVRHGGTALRLSPSEIRHTVDTVGLRCTHFDACRFFTDEAAPLNQNPISPSRALQPELEQPGCVHATMDLYKYAMWCAPYLASELVADCFALARRARTVDMRASPYDLIMLGHEAIRVETAEGRREYVMHQRALSEEAAGLRARLVMAIEGLV